MMNPERIAAICSEMAVLRFYPSREDPAARLAIIRLIGAMAANEAQVLWLVRRMTSGLFTDWPGIGELRAVFCSKFRPCDGIEKNSMFFPDGIPSEVLPPPEPAMLPNRTEDRKLLKAALRGSI